MGRKQLSLSGAVFGRLTVTKTFENRGTGNGIYWKCVCDCGCVLYVRASNLVNGHVSSCGCYRREHISDVKRKHGMSGSRLYGIWNGIRNRCGNKRVAAYERYGGRGIYVCDEWKEFDAFMSWANASGYGDDLTIDRIDNDGNYCPENCQWITKSENSRRSMLRRLGRAYV